MLTHQEIVTLYGFLRLKFADQGELQQLEFHAVKNDVLDKLIAQKELPEDLGRVLLSIYRDTSTDPLLRDYCVQHFAAYHQRKWPKGTIGADKSDPERNDVMAAYWEALEETDTSIAATALMGLRRLAAESGEAERQQVCERALALAVDDGAGLATRTAALQVCALMRVREVLPVARELAHRGKTMGVRLSAIAALGQIGDEEDASILKRIAASSEPYPRRAAEKALRRMGQRLHRGRS
jgi:hypothetical protein